jgi:hypothetical protein
MVLLGDDAQVEAWFNSFGDSANLNERYENVCANLSQAQKSFWRHPMELIGDVGHVESRFGLFGDNVSVGAR